MFEGAHRGRHGGARRGGSLNPLRRRDPRRQAVGTGLGRPQVRPGGNDSRSAGAATGGPVPPRIILGVLCDEEGMMLGAKAFPAAGGLGPSRLGGSAARGPDLLATRQRGAGARREPGRFPRYDSQVAIPVSRMCLTCSHFRPDAHPAPTGPTTAHSSTTPSTTPSCAWTAPTIWRPDHRHTPPHQAHFPASTDARRSRRPPAFRAAAVDRVKACPGTASMSLENARPDVAHSRRKREGT
jgi:hypothetical protein